MLWWLPKLKLFPFLLHNCNFATLFSHKVNIWYAGYLIRNSYVSSFNPKRDCDTLLRHIVLDPSLCYIGFIGLHVCWIHCSICITPPWTSCEMGDHYSKFSGMCPLSMWASPHPTLSLISIFSLWSNKIKEVNRKFFLNGSFVLKL